MNVSRYNVIENSPGTFFKIIAFVAENGFETPL